MEKFEIVFRNENMNDNLKKEAILNNIAANAKAVSNTKDMVLLSDFLNGVKINEKNFTEEKNIGILLPDDPDYVNVKNFIMTNKATTTYLADNSIINTISVENEWTMSQPIQQPKHQGPYCFYNANRDDVLNCLTECYSNEINKALNESKLFNNLNFDICDFGVFAIRYHYLAKVYNLLSPFPSDYLGNILCSADGKYVLSCSFNFHYEGASTYFITTNNYKKIRKKFFQSAIDDLKAEREALNTENKVIIKNNRKINKYNKLINSLNKSLS
jgi:hypothetical protein